MGVRHIAVGVMGAVFSSAAPAFAAVITNIGVLGIDTRSGATDVNDAGVVVGASSRDTTGFGTFEFHAFRFSAGTIQPVGTLGGVQSAAQGVNNSGVAVGWAHNSSDVEQRGFYQTPPAAPQPTPGTGVVMDINDNGVMVGGGVAFANGHAFLWTGSGSPQDLGVIGGTFSVANDINNSNVVVGYSNINSTSTRKAVRWTSTGGLQALAGFSNVSDSEAYAVNEVGTIVGYFNGPSPRTPFRYSGNGPAVTLPGGGGDARDINDAGFVVGQTSTFGHAALWRPDNTLLDLDSWLNTNYPAEGAQWTLTIASAISNTGWIAGTGQFNGGQAAFLLDGSSLVPEPSAMSLLVPLATLLVKRRRRPPVH